MSKYFKTGVDNRKKKLVMKFLAYDEHYNLLVNTIKHPSVKNKEQLNLAFQDYYTEIRIIRYLANAFYFNSINFDKRERLYNFRNTLALDKKDDEGLICVDRISSDEYLVNNESFGNGDLFEGLEREGVIKGYQKLTNRQKFIVTAKYKHEMKEEEISNLLSISQQAISKNHKKALLIIKNAIFNEERR
ncbi:hypothetical protein ACM26V_17020 [Salipaludibacillus sp. HK11]|uniref:hypothetical protein n=1 Tax=Salipaludibacillus sp. HK11 TaxID=3394320 RepID=UPI0039FD9A65